MGGRSRQLRNPRTRRNRRYYLNHSYCCIITDSQSEPLANGILEIAQGSTVWRVRVLDGGIGQVLEHEFLQFIGMDEDLPPMSGQILSREDGDILRIKPLSELGENARKNLRVPVRFDSFLYPLSGSWRGRLPIVSYDLSCGGIAFFCDHPLGVGETAEVVIPITTRPLLLNLQILRTLPSGSPTPLYAARFMNVIHDQEVLLRKAVFSQQLRGSNLLPRKS